MPTKRFNTFLQFRLAAIPRLPFGRATLNIFYLDTAAENTIYSITYIQGDSILHEQNIFMM